MTTSKVQCYLDRCNYFLQRNCSHSSNIRYGSSQLGDLGSGAGKGGGGGGTIRESGGSFGKREAAQEEEYFYRQQKEQLSKLKDSLHDEISFHEEQIERHKEAIARNKKRVEELAAQNKK